MNKKKEKKFANKFSQLMNEVEYEWAVKRQRNFPLSIADRTRVKS